MNVFDYLASLPQKTLEDLFQDPWTCQAVFRSLPPISKQYVTRLLFSSGQTEQMVEGWCKPGEERKHTAAIDNLVSLQVCSRNTEAKTTKSNSSIKLNPLFQKQLQSAICLTGTPPWATRVKEEKKSKKPPPDVKYLDTHAKNSWEALLRFMIGNPMAKPSSSITDLLVRTGLMKLCGEDAMEITNLGYQFLLKDAYTQMWTLLLSYIETAEARKMEKKEVLSFLFQLSFLSFGKSYPVQGLTASQSRLLQDLREFGLVFMRNSSSHSFYPTRMAIRLAGAGAGSDTAEENPEGFIILESNYRVYAYTSSELQLSILSLFVELRYRLPNMITGAITRKNVRQALTSGITADQIINYLRTNAHPEMKKNTPWIPETVTDQIRLWEQERNRVTYAKGVLYDAFANVEAYQKVVQYAKDLGVFIWTHPEKKMVMVKDEGHDAIRAYIKRHLSG
eukprot:TRINITY_DN382_c0_g1_i1.p1 TRINITY_DN382_c0_g1~~TRINITY_DN382_c0_g1_i1.p1  ORF type:complete len:450 (-),score=100.54 TRINITY_DN382_c0_g1_i1:46-1395(-)